jgi:arginyl-tRNA synthetase
MKIYVLISHLQIFSFSVSAYIDTCSARIEIINKIKQVLGNTMDIMGVPKINHIP